MDQLASMQGGGAIPEVRIPLSREGLLKIQSRGVRAGCQDATIVSFTTLCPFGLLRLTSLPRDSQH